MSAQLLFHLVCGIVFIIVSITDLRDRRIPNQIIIPAIGIAFALTFSLWPLWPSALIGAVIGAVVLLIPAIFFGGRGGMGDVKLALFMGLILGQQGIIFALIIAHLSASLLWIGVLFKKIERDAMIPFGPFLSLGAIVALVGYYANFWGGN